MPAHTSPSSEWYATPNEKRTRKIVQVTLADEEREALERLAQDGGLPMSRIVAAGILALAAMGKRELAAALDAAAERAPKRRARRRG